MLNRMFKLLTLSLSLCLANQVVEHAGGSAEESAILKEFTPREFIPTYADSLPNCQPKSNVKYWFIGASEIGASYIQNDKKARGMDLFFSIGSRFNFTKMQASSFEAMGHSLAIKTGMEYFRFLTHPQYDNLMFSTGIDYSYVSEAKLGISIGLSTYISLLSNSDSHLTAGVALSYGGVFARGEYVILPFKTSTKILNTFKVSLGYKF